MRFRAENWTRTRRLQGRRRAQRHRPWTQQQLGCPANTASTHLLQVGWCCPTSAGWGPSSSQRGWCYRHKASRFSYDMSSVPICQAPCPSELEPSVPPWVFPENIVELSYPGLLILASGKWSVLIPDPRKHPRTVGVESRFACQSILAVAGCMGRRALHEGETQSRDGEWAAGSGKRAVEW